MQELFSVGFADTLVRFALCLLVNWGIVQFLYFRKSKRRDFYFTFVIISVAIYFLVYLMMGMDRGKATMGVGLGLFGIFSIMRYRTDSMPVREMTYLFVVVCLAVVHAMASPIDTDGTPLLRLVIIDIITILTIVVFEQTLRQDASKLVQYDRIELIKPERRQELVADLHERTGLDVLNVEIGAIDFLHDTVVLRVYYKSGSHKKNDIDNMIKIKSSNYANI